MSVFQKYTFAIGGMLISYFLVCPRKAWLSMRGLWMEQESETVALGRLLDESSYQRSNKHLTLEAVSREGIALVGKIDRANLREGVLHETKKGKACEAAHQWQLRFYLWLLRLNGVTRANGQAFTGQLDYPALRRSEPVTLEAEHEKYLAQVVLQLEAIHHQSSPPPRLSRRSFCRKCAFEELCYG